ncbi:hypothetical protein SBA4_4520003 [Candidatus Sulfopaludibacter sp. SbA4]|nr:hypothetical protein SBA4_4520003 [Candidatus Sulfopaludibacter sp. SbA4]
MAGAVGLTLLWLGLLGPLLLRLWSGLRALLLLLRLSLRALLLCALLLFRRLALIFLLLLVLRVRRDRRPEKQEERSGSGNSNELHHSVSMVAALVEHPQHVGYEKNHQDGAYPNARAPTRAPA